jgi:hypothetical protein
VRKVIISGKRFRGCEQFRTRRLRGGFALVELLIASGVLGFLMISLYACYSYGFSLVRLSQENVRADQILVQKLETLRMYDWAKVTGGSYIPTAFTNSFSGTLSTAGGVIYKGTMSVNKAPIAGSYADSLRQVTVSLSWNSGGNARTRSMTTLYSQNGLQTYKP